MKIKWIQNLIDILRGKIIYADAFILRKKYTDKCINYDTIVVGSSHLECYAPKDNEIKLAIASQDLYYAYKMYEKFNNSNVKNVITSFSVFTPGHCVLKTCDAEMCILYKIFFGIDYEYEDYALTTEIYKKEEKVRKMLKHFHGNIHFNLFNFKPSKSTVEKQTADRALRHLKNNKREPDEMIWFEKLLEDTKANGQNLTIVIPPATNFYKNALPSSEELFSKLYRATQKYDHLKIFNMYDANYFEDKDFANSDHLSHTSHPRYSDIIRENAKN